MAFFQSPPELGNTYDGDPLLQSFLARELPVEVLTEIQPELREMGELSGGELYRLKLDDRLNEPVFTPFDPWGNRIDHIALTPLWERAKRLAAEKGLVATAYERRHGRFSRLHQLALVHLFEPSSDIYSCPLAMTDGAARTLLSSGNAALVVHAVPRLTSRDPARMWTSGQWMTERTGGSDVGLSETVAKRDGDVWRLYGTKWFTSAASSEMTLTLARPEGNGPGGAGLALFYLETRDAAGRPNALTVNRLKDKLGTRKLPTGEIDLHGTLALPVAGLDGGVRAITPLLNVTRLWNSVAAVAGMRRAAMLARSYAARRVAFGGPLSQKPLHEETLKDVEAVTAGAFLLTFRVAALLGKSEANEIGEEEALLLRVLTPLAKLLTARQAVAVASEVLESFGGAGYVEDTGLPVLLRDAQVLPIWEGTTNVLSLDLLRALAGKDLGVLLREVARATASASTNRLARAAAKARAALEHADSWLLAARASGNPARLEAGARRLAFTAGLALEVAFLVEHASHHMAFESLAMRLARNPVDQVLDSQDEESFTRGS